MAVTKKTQKQSQADQNLNEQPTAKIVHGVRADDLGFEAGYRKEINIQERSHSTGHIYIWSVRKVLNQQ
jgi:hypothetical protein